PCIQRATEDYVHVIRLYKIPRSFTDTYKLWQITPDHPAPFQDQAAVEANVDSGYGIELQRVDDSRMVIWSDNSGKLDGRHPSIIVLEVVDEATGVSLVKKWQSNLQITVLQSIASRNVLCIENDDDDERTLLDLADGSELQRVYPDCWGRCNLYPPETLWANVDGGANWRDPLRDAALDKAHGTEQSWAQSALFFDDGLYTVFDYSASRD
ncbi:hypothetical protein THASP1DRAFT_32842, partial [Thamnocephalis sphaerospora]